MPEPTYKATSIEELKNLAKLPEDFFRKFNTAEMIQKSIDTLYKTAEEQLEKGDKETAYIFFMRCLSCFTFLKKQTSIPFDEKYFRIMYGKQINQALKHFELLDVTLREWYEQRRQKQNNNQITKVSATEKAQINVYLDGIDKKMTEHSPRCNGLEGTPTEKKNCISSKELFHSMVENAGTPILTLIIDMRSEEDFRHSSIKLNDVINIPEKKIDRGVTATKLESCLEENFRTYFKRRGEYDRIVIYDWFSTETMQSNKIQLLLSILIKWDINTKYKTTPLILEGGFEDWHARYPTWTTNPLAKLVEKTRNNSRFVLEKIDYPTNDIFESEVAEKGTGIIGSCCLKPAVDRSTKPLVSIEKKNENANTTEECSKKIISEKSDIVSAKENDSFSIKNENFEPKTNEINLDLKKGYVESDEELKNQYCQGGRRSALTSTVNQSPLYKKINGHIDDEDTNLRSRNEKSDEDESCNKTLPDLFENVEKSSKMKRCSSTPNILKLTSAENDRPSVDRTTKPSNDDQLNYYTMGCKYNTTGKGLVGLKNIGNTCYMNSVIQCLSNTVDLRNRFCDRNFRPLNANSKTRGNVAREFANIIRQLWSGDGNAVSCRSFKNIISQFNDMFVGHDQQDAHEFLTILIDWLHEDLNEPPLKGLLDGAVESSGEKAWGEFTRKNNSIVRRLFYGQLRSTVSCITCKKQSITFEPFSNLSLPLPSEETEKCSLQDCLKLYTSNDEVDKWLCPGCQNLRRASKQLEITRLPPVLVIHFKRFTSIGGCKKQRTFVDFPDKLNMKQFINGREQRFSQYELYAISNHTGSMESGHYTAYCKNSIDQRWYTYDDQNINITRSPIKSKEAYIVFYRCMGN